MAIHLENLKGKELSAYIAEGRAVKEDIEFANHLKHYGTAEDFAAWVSHPNPHITAQRVCQFFPYCPELALPMVIDALDNNATSTIHYDVLLLLPSYRVDLAIRQNIHAHINFRKIAPQDLPRAFEFVLSNGPEESVLNNRELFAPLFQKDPAGMCIKAAFWGWDLAEVFDLNPPLGDEYFMACCAGNLVAPAQQCNITDNPDLVRSAFSAALHRKVATKTTNDAILTYLWNAYPTVAWHEDLRILNMLYDAPVSVLPDILEHYNTHVPQAFQRSIVNLAGRCAESGYMGQLEVFYPWVPSEQRPHLMYSAMYNQEEDVLRLLLAQPDSPSHFIQALALCEEEGFDDEMEWAQEIYNQHQHTLLRATVDGDATQKAQKKKM